MNMKLPTSTDNGPSKIMHTSLSGREQDTAKHTGLLGRWYRLTVPVEPQNATPHDRETARVGQLSSLILLITLCFGLVLLPDTLFSINPLFLPILLVCIVINVVALVLNRQGKVMLVGVIMVIMMEMAFMAVVLSTPGGLSVRGLPTFDLMALTELVAVSLLPPKSVFPVALCNCLFTWAAITFQPRAADLAIILPRFYYNTLIQPMVLQMVVAVVTYLWVRGAIRAIARAERVAALERVMAEQDRTIAEQKQQLDLGIQQILQTHIQVANGDFSVRAPLARENVLWQVAHNLNNLLARLQRATQSEYDLQRTKMEVGHLLEAVRSAKIKRRPIQATKSGTCLDPLAQELTGKHIGSAEM